MTQIEKQTDRLARIMFDGLIGFMSIAQRERFKQRAPWHDPSIMAAATAALPALLNDIDFALALTSEVS